MIPAERNLSMVPRKSGEKRLDLIEEGKYYLRHDSGPRKVGKKSEERKLLAALFIRAISSCY